MGSARKWKRQKRRTHCADRLKPELHAADRLKPELLATDSKALKPESSQDKRKRTKPY
jgi:hypothetical protein